MRVGGGQFSVLVSVVRVDQRIVLGPVCFILFCDNDEGHLVQIFFFSIRVYLFIFDPYFFWVVCFFLSIKFDENFAPRKLVKHNNHYLKGKAIDLDC